MKAAVALLPAAILIAIPLLLRDAAVSAPSGTTALIVVTPHNEAIRHEFERGFREYMENNFHESVAIDWRTPGGTSEIVKYIDDQYGYTFARELGGKFTADQRRKFNVAAEPDNPARAAFLASDLGIGIDVFFGGGQIDYSNFANKGYLVDTGLIAKHPDWFTDAVIPQKLGGEVLYDKEGRYFGACLASFGICYNRDRLAFLDAPMPDNWLDLGDPRLFGAVAMADPTKSGSINRCFEMMIQQVMGGATAQGANEAALERGWSDGFLLIKKIAANARHVTDSASKVTRDVGRGDAAAGMCIDFYGRTEQQWLLDETGESHLLYLTPAGGTSVSADPIACFRGAPHRDLAVKFIEYTLSPEGQRLWNYRVGAPGGPKRYPLRHWPIRKDLFAAEHRPYMSDAGENPYDLAEMFHYQPAFTGPYFILIRQMIKALALDPRPELISAWKAIADAGGPEHAPEAMRELAWMPFAYKDAAEIKKSLNADPLQTLRILRRWTEDAQRHYRRAEELARANR